MLLHYTVSASYRSSHQRPHQPTSSTTSGEAESRLRETIEGHAHARHTGRLSNTGASMSLPARSGASLGSMHAHPHITAAIASQIISRAIYVRL